MCCAIIISLLLVTVSVFILVSNQRRMQTVLSMGLFSFKFKYIGGSLVILSIFLSLFKLMEDELYNNIRMIIANLGLIIIVLSRDKLEFKDSGFIKMACFSLATFISYLVYHLMIIFWGIEETIQLPQFILDILVIYIISYYCVKPKVVKRWISSLSSFYPLNI